MAQTILVVDDDPVQRRLLEAAISRGGMQVVTAPGGQPALDLINGPRGDQITLMLLDLVMPDMGGLEVLEKLRSTNPDLPVIVLTAKGGIDSAVDAMRAGANDFLVKPASPERIAVSIRNQLKIGTLSGEVKQLKKKQDNKLCFDDLDGPPVVIGSRNWITPAAELEASFFPQVSWMLDAIHERILPLKGYQPSTNQTL